jgi:hypothetical protein
MGQTNKDRAFELAEKVLQLEAEIKAMKSLAAERMPLTEEAVHKASNEILSRETSRLRSAELRELFEKANDDDSLIRILHAEILSRAAIL